MRRLLISATTGLLALALVPVASGASHHAKAKAPTPPKVDGSGFSATYGRITVDAQLAKKGPRGHFDLKQVKAHGRVTCVNVTSRTTAFVGGVDSKKGGFLIYIEDNAKHGRNKDRHAFEPTAAPPAQGTCADPSLVAKAATITRGNYTIKPSRP